MATATRARKALAEREGVVYEYEVTGTGEFPLDMLRHDRAWPAHEGQISLFALNQHATTMRERERAITIRGLRPPTVRRWASFDWAVSTTVREREWPL